MTLLLDPPSAIGAVLSEAASGVAAVQAAVADGRAGGLGHDELADLVEGVRALQARLESVALAAIGEVEGRGSHVGDGALTAASWLRMTSRVTHSQATATVRAARALRSGLLPLTAEALASGEISSRHVEVLASFAADAPAEAVALIEPHVLEVAKSSDVRAVGQVMRQFQHALDPDAADEKAIRRYERRGFTMVPTLDGSFSMSGNADEANGALIASALDAASPLVSGDKRTAAQRRLDALAEISRRFLRSPDAPRSGGGHAHVVVSTDVVTMRPQAAAPEAEDGPRAADRCAEQSDGGAGQSDGAAERSDGGAERSDGGAATSEAGFLAQLWSPGAMLSWAGHIVGTTAQRIACDAEVTTVLLDGSGSVVDSRTDWRFFTAAQRRAMIARDGDRCFWPWCDRPVAWADGHHVVPWAAGGRTSTDNGALPCEGHHVMLHEAHWTVERMVDGRYVVTHPDGRTVGPEPYPPGHLRPGRREPESPPGEWQHRDAGPPP